MDAVGDGGVIVEKKDINGIGVGVDENVLAPNLELVRGGLARVGKDAVSDFETVDIGLILYKAAESIGDGIGKESKNGDQE